MENMYEVASFVKDRVKKHHEWFNKSLPMIASENLMSPLAKEVYNSDFMDRYAEGHPGERYYHGNVYVDEVELKSTEIARKLFKCEWADVRPTSATVANLGMLKALAKPGDTIGTVGLSQGAHISTAKFGAVGIRGLKRAEYPFDPEIMNIDVDATNKMIREVQPKVCLFGESVFLFPSPIKELSEAIQEVGANAWYDGAHVLGLIAGGEFQDPLREGVMVLTGSTHKTLPGPQHGLVVANPPTEKMRKKLDSGIFPGVVSNHHLHAMAALTVAMAEHIEFGAAYAKQVIANSQALGQALYERGFKVLAPHLGFTKSHTLSIDVEPQGGGSDVAQLLEDCNIITNKNLLPRDTSPRNPSGIRVGSQELTRLGMKEAQMVEVADIYKMALMDKKPIPEVHERAWELKKDFNTVKYCYRSGEEPAYKFWERYTD